jgi:hypothetical protein
MHVESGVCGEDAIGYSRATGGIASTGHRQQAFDESAAFGHCGRPADHGQDVEIARRAETAERRRPVEVDPRDRVRGRVADERDETVELLHHRPL